MALGEQLIHDTYEALRAGPGWAQTLLVLTYDEHGGCYDHVPPPWGATPPDNTAGEFGFGFNRFGVRVPTLLISPLIAPGTVYRVPAGSTPLDHTSILKTVEQRWNLPPLTARDAAAPGFGDVLTLDAAAHRRRPGRASPSRSRAAPARRPARSPTWRRSATSSSPATHRGPAPAQRPRRHHRRSVVQDPDQRPPQGDAPRALAATAAIIQDPDQLP